MNVGWIKGDELDQLSPIFLQEGWSPLPKSAMAILAFDGEGIAGFHVLRPHPFAGPAWVRPDKRGGPLAVILAKHVNELIEDSGSPVIVVADNPVVAKMCELFGMRRVESPVYIRD